MPVCCFFIKHYEKLTTYGSFSFYLGEEHSQSVDSIPPIKEKSQEAVNGSAGGHKSPEGGKTGNVLYILLLFEAFL